MKEVGTDKTISFSPIYCEQDFGATALFGSLFALPFSTVLFFLCARRSVPYTLAALIFNIETGRSLSASRWSEMKKEKGSSRFRRLKQYGGEKRSKEEVHRKGVLLFPDVCCSENRRCGMTPSATTT